MSLREQPLDPPVVPAALREAVLEFEAFAADRAVVPADATSRYVSALRLHWRIIAAAAALAVGAALAVTLLAQKQYDATSKIVLARSQVASTLFQGSPSLDPERDVNTNLGIVTSEAVAQRVKQRLHLSEPLANLVKNVSAATAGNSNIVAIDARDRDPHRAAAIANAFAAEYAAYANQQTRAQYRTAAQSVDRQLKTLTPSRRAAPQGQALLDRRQQLGIAADVNTSGIQLLDPALPPTSAASPRPKLNLALGLLMGLIVGCALAGAVARVGTQRVRRMPAL